MVPRRSDVLKAVDEVIRSIEAGASTEDLHEGFTELIIDLERAVKRMYEKIYEKEGKKSGVALIENFVSGGRSSLVLRADGLGEKEYAAMREEFKKFQKTLEG